MLMLLAASRDMPAEQRSICTREMVRGFREACAQAEAPVTGGQTVLNPWPVIGGVATAIVTSKDDFVPSDGAQPGNVVVLTKPLGTQIAVNVHEWRRQRRTSNERLWLKCQQDANLTDESAERMMHEAVMSMARLNRTGARLMTKHRATAGTDVTGFGILGHAQNLADNQVQAVSMEIHTLPCLKGTPAVNTAVMDFRLLTGYSAETSGGLMVCMAESDAVAFCKELEEVDGCPAWIIGRVVANPERKSRIVDEFKVLEV